MKHTTKLKIVGFFYQVVRDKVPFGVFEGAFLEEISTEISEVQIVKNQLDFVNELINIWNEDQYEIAKHGICRILSNIEHRGYSLYSMEYILEDERKVWANHCDEITLSNGFVALYLEDRLETLMDLWTKT